MIKKTLLFSHYIVLFIVLSIFVLTRLYQIDLTPNSLYWDEASIGYNAYSILKTGKDEWGEFLPIHFKAFGEYKLPVYIYSVVGTEALLGMNELAVRLPAVLFSFGSVLVVYFLMRELWQDKRAALLSIFVLVFSPWFFIFSRSGYEVSAGLFFLLLGIFLFFKALKNPPLFFIATLSFLLAIYSYNSFRVLLPFLGFYFIVFILRKEQLFLLKKWWILILCLLLFVLGTIPIIQLYLSPDGLTRYNQVGIYQPGISKKVAAVTFFDNYLAHFNPYYLFLTGDSNLRSHVGEVGELFWITFPFILIGFIALIKKRNLQSLFVLFLLIIAPIPAALTKESPHALRSLLMVVPLSIMAGIGIQSACAKSRFNLYLLASTMLIFCLLFSIYFQRFTTVYAKQSAADWQYGYKVVFSAYGERFSQYDHVLVSDRYAEPYIFDAFYRQLSPHAFQTERILNQEPRVKTSLVYQFGNVIFDDVTIEKIAKGTTLVFAHPEEKLYDTPEIQTILNPDNSVAFYVYEIKK